MHAIYNLIKNGETISPRKTKCVIEEKLKNITMARDISALSLFYAENRLGRGGVGVVGRGGVGWEGVFGKERFQSNFPTACYDWWLVPDEKYQRDSLFEPSSKHEFILSVFRKCDGDRYHNEIKKKMIKKFMVDSKF